MTVINVIRHRDAVHMLADGHFYDDGSGSVNPGTKLWGLPHLNAAIGVRGPIRMGPVLATTVGHLARSYDELKACAAECLPLLLEDVSGCPEPGEWDLVVGGISETIGPDAWLLCSHDKFVRPWTMYDLNGPPSQPAMRGLAMLPSDGEMYPEILAVLDGRDAADLDPVADGIRLMQIQRAKWIGRSDAAPGAFLQLMTVTSDAIVTRIIHRWD